MSDRELLNHYVIQGSENAFSELVYRHVNLVYSVALRRLADAAAAQEVTQSVFCLLPKKPTGRDVKLGLNCEGHKCLSDLQQNSARERWSEPFWSFH